MSQGPYPPGYEPADGSEPPRRPPGEGYPESGRGSARVPQPDWPAQQRQDGSSSYPAPQYAGPESPYDPHGQYRRPQPTYGGEQPDGGFGGQQSGGFGAQPGGGPGGPSTYPQQQPGQYGEPGRPGGYGDPTQYHDPTQFADRGPEAGRFNAL